MIHVLDSHRETQGDYCNNTGRRTSASGQDEETETEFTLPPEAIRKEDTIEQCFSDIGHQVAQGTVSLEVRSNSGEPCDCPSLLAGEFSGHSAEEGNLTGAYQSH